MNDTYAAKEITAALVDALKHQGLCLKEALRLIEKGEEMAERIRGEGLEKKNEDFAAEVAKQMGM